MYAKLKEIHISIHFCDRAKDRFFLLMNQFHAGACAVRAASACVHVACH